jgi:hypothetical protein
VTEAEDTPPETPDAPESLPSSPNVDVNAAPAPTQADRVAAVPIAPPPPDAQVEDTVREAVVPDEATTAEVVTEETTPTAPEETATEIAIEDEKPSGLVETSLRPVSRPRPTAPPAPEPDTATETAEAPTETETPNDDAVAAALAAALATEAPNVATSAIPLGQGLSDTEMRNVVSAIGRKWIVDNGARSSNVVIVVAFSLRRDGQLDGDVDLISNTDAPAEVVDAAFRAARSSIWAVSRSGGFPLPIEKYESWKNVEAAFDPSGMRLR